MRSKIIVVVKARDVTHHNFTQVTSPPINVKAPALPLRRKLVWYALATSGIISCRFALFGSLLRKCEPHSRLERRLLPICPEETASYDWLTIHCSELNPYACKIMSFKSLFLCRCRHMSVPCGCTMALQDSLFPSTQQSDIIEELLNLCTPSTVAPYVYLSQVELSREHSSTEIELEYMR